ncbi:hypothetical protein GWK47_011072 [Chionoecetes opilio]|uniref:Uncharacterized protein n=1 Tax=Chionoecetes opilio TaxID=41210 RepID=A0A8J5CMN5_CHIOP|nr:hypothetical protein GWK47_011072 [Chionoecetes opilio]
MVNCPKLNREEHVSVTRGASCRYLVALCYRGPVPPEKLALQVAQSLSMIWLIKCGTVSHSRWLTTALRSCTCGPKANGPNWQELNTLEILVKLMPAGVLQKLYSTTSRCHHRLEDAPAHPHAAQMYMRSQHKRSPNRCAIHRARQRGVGSQLQNVSSSR